MSEYVIKKNSPQDLFRGLRSKVQIFGGGYGNGKTAAAVVSKVLLIAEMYPGANILVARATLPKLNDTTRKEFLKWCPKAWIKSFPLAKNSSNTCTLHNGTEINFRYISQQGKSLNDGELGTSNLLSATYDLIVIDQIEDPEITRKDFDDMLGRLRGNARYVGNDPTMPLTGPRWLVACTNPTSNWFYSDIVAPLLLFQKTGLATDELLCEREPAMINGLENPTADKPILDTDGKAQPIISLVEGSTYTNSHNLGADFISTLENTYRGQQKKRFLYGLWASYEGLVHPDFNKVTHVLSQDTIIEYLNSLIMANNPIKWIAGYDYGIVKPCAFILAFADKAKNVFLVDGFYDTLMNFSMEEQQAQINEYCETYGIEGLQPLADPAIFKKSQITEREGVKTIADLFKAGDNPVRFRAADNEILRGITKVNSYVNIKKGHAHPITGEIGAPHLYVSDTLVDVIKEFDGYYWKVGRDGKRVDQPIDRNDHAMNALKYMLSKEPDLMVRSAVERSTEYLHNWSEAREPRRRR